VKRIGILLLTISIGAVTVLAQPRIEIACTTTIIGDVVAQIVGEDVDVFVLFPPNTDPHAFEPRPQDVVALGRADLILINGLGLEASLASILDATETPVIALSDGLSGLLPASGAPATQDGGDHAHDAYDPHVWFDPTLVLQWLDVIVEQAGALAPDLKDSFSARAVEYGRRLGELDAWIQSSVAAIPETQREIVSDHQVLTYFAQRYGFHVAGTVIPGISSLAEPSARSIADLVSVIKALDVPAIFVGTTVNPSLAEQIAADTGTKLITLYTGSLSDPEGPAGTYLDFMRYTTNGIVEGLGGSS
jgi:ABC-type Zn uptake system ZnuABC Zn-binding protein ZnuA